MLETSKVETLCMALGIGSTPISSSKCGRADYRYVGLVCGTSKLWIQLPPATHQGRHRTACTGRGVEGARRHQSLWGRHWGAEIPCKEFAVSSILTYSTISLRVLSKSGLCTGLKHRLVEFDSQSTHQVCVSVMMPERNSTEYSKG